MLTKNAKTLSKYASGSPYGKGKYSLNMTTSLCD